ncbi:hypothetical protein BCR43DRAFT_500635 [Syncephalastrum racemosum]|uniref:Uncharacterized protein n=1 Tax=Syncephalastrum racemosum TaxID=13706 RepID=A0A1X2HSP8_SYNRA|nr:hypothetical protein BCR43DRAFT_500635 [Syncephalastrum racemosum]
MSYGFNKSFSHKEFQWSRRELGRYNGKGYLQTSESFRWSEARYLAGDFHAYDAFDELHNPLMDLWRQLGADEAETAHWFLMFQEACAKQQAWCESDSAVQHYNDIPEDTALYSNRVSPAATHRSSSSISHRHRQQTYQPQLQYEPPLEETMESYPMEPTLLLRDRQQGQEESESQVRWGHAPRPKKPSIRHVLQSIKRATPDPHRS